jgi:Sugar phosphate permease
MKKTSANFYVNEKPTFGIILSATIGSVIEWYDLFVYGSLIVILSHVFFPMTNYFISVLSSIGAFVAGAAVRPLGGLIFGSIGDKLGRKYSFTFTIIIMGSCSFLTGLLPTYSSIGIIAPILLVILRIIQGLALGGEWPGASIFLAESSPKNKIGYWTSYVQASATTGLLLASLASYLSNLFLGYEDFLLWGWRIPFLFSSILLIVGIVSRLRLSETPIFIELIRRKEISNNPIKESLLDKNNLKLIMIIILIAGGSSVVWHTAQYISSIFMQSYLHLNFLIVTEIMILSFALSIPFFIFFGWLSDKIGRFIILALGNLLFSIIVIPVYYLIPIFVIQKNYIGIFFLVFIQIFLSSMTYGPLAAFMIEIFKSKIRYTSISIPYGIATGDIGDGSLLIVPILGSILGSFYLGLIWSFLLPLISFLILVLFRKSFEIKEN